MSKTNQSKENLLSGFSNKQLLEELRSRELKLLDDIAIKQAELTKASDSISRRITKATKLSTEIADLSVTLMKRKPRTRLPKDGTLIKYIIDILSNGRCMRIQEIYEAAKSNGWTTSSTDPRKVISFTLASNKDFFEKVSLGTYRAKKNEPTSRTVDLDWERSNGS